MNQKKSKTYRIAIIGILSAIIFIQNFVPMLGYLPIPPLNPTIIHITVIIAALTLGAKDGMIIGGVWGITRFVKAFVMPASPLDLLLFTNPFIAILPRILVGLVAGASYYALKRKMADTSAMVIASILGSLTNTILVLFFIYLFNSAEYAEAMKVSIDGLLKVLGTIVLTNGVAEAIAAAIIAPFIATALKRISR
ncbi:ECF transporter S component [Carnobacterium gallinarum]|uniref:ECF transporter S component n=1 Tax=Carnobacterium gallinarum TaxID=2749 RepID=UPI00055479CD|nr:ECF transporter S component [Carnobacterium gallinarum]